jgi:hypothetical protein
MKRPERYVPLSLTFATGRTGTALLEQYGVEGLGAWAAMLAAAKGNQPEGQVVFRHEDDWAAIGLGFHPPSFTLAAFLTYLGRRKLIRRTRHGRVTYVEITQWGRWHDAKNSYLAARRSSRYRQEKKRDEKRTSTVTQTIRDRDAELESPSGLEKELKTTPSVGSPSPSESNGRAEEKITQAEVEEVLDGTRQLLRDL